MSLQLTAQGLQIDTYEDIFTRLVDGYKSIYGADIVVDQDSPDGQRIGIEAKAQYDLQVALLALYNALDVDLAKGEQLNKLIKLAGISRRDSLQSSWDLQVTATTSTTLPNAFRIKDNSGEIWLTGSSTTLLSGVNTVTFFSERLGAVVGSSLATFEFVDVNPDVSTVTTGGVGATVGKDEETDEELRLRRGRSVASASYSTVGGLIAKLYSIKNVSDVAIYENDTNATVGSIPSHTLWIVVDGGDIVSIAEAIARNKTAGTGLKGSTTGTYVETLPNGKTYTHVVKFDRPTTKEIFVKIDVKNYSTLSLNTNRITTNLTSYKLGIAETLYAFKLYSTATQGLSDLSVVNLQVSFDGLTYTSEKLAPAQDERLVITPSKITITEV